MTHVESREFKIRRMQDTQALVIFKQDIDGKEMVDMECLVWAIQNQFQRLFEELAEIRKVIADTHNISERILGEVAHSYDDSESYDPGLEESSSSDEDAMEVISRRVRPLIKKQKKEFFVEI